MFFYELDIPFDWSKQWPGYVCAFCSAFLVTYLCTPICRKIALKFGIVDQPDQRKIHTEDIPRLGGLVFYLALLVSLLFVLLVYPELWRSEFLGLVLGALVIMLLGVVDDVVGLGATVKFAVQILVGYIAYRSGFRIEQLTNPFGGTVEIVWLSEVLSILWFVGLMNAINLIDGLDGLASGIICIASVGMLATAFMETDVVICLFSFILMGITLAFLRYNFYPAKIFMGDSGSLLLGYLMAAMSILGQSKGVTAITLLIPLVALGLPILDTALAIFRRLLRRQHLFQADQEHLHHRLLKIGLTHRQVVILIYLICICLSLTAFILSELPPTYTLLVLIVLATGFFVGMELLKFIESKVEQIFHLQNQNSKNND